MWVCEKPLCFTTDQAEELQRISREKGLLFGVHLHLYGLHHVQGDEGNDRRRKIGNIVAVNAEYTQDWLLGEP